MCVSHGAVEVHERVVEHGRSAAHLPIANAETVSGVGISLRVGKKLRQRLLAVLQYADTKTPAIVEMQVGLGEVVDTDKHQRRPQRDRAERTGGHSVYLTVLQFNRDDGNAAGKAAKRGAKLIG